MRMVYCLMALSIALSVAHTGYGQSPTIVPVSPEAAALAKMVNYPVNYNTGMPEINIPFYTVQIGGLDLPINLDYHAGGFRINEQATRAGLGWSLSSDLQITRTVNGLDDFTPSIGYIANTLARTHYSDVTCGTCFYPLTSATPYPYANAYDLAMGLKDGMPDKFTYKLLNKSGSFYFQKDHSGTGYTIVPVPFNNLQITYNNGQFIIVDTDGSTYYFGMPGAINMSQQATSGKEVSGQIDISGGCNNCVVTAWKCMKIENSTKTDEITFTYETKVKASFRSYQDKIEYYSNNNPCNLFTYHTSNDYPMNSFSTYEQLMLYVPFHEISTPKYLSVYGGSGYSYFHVPYFTSPLNAIDVYYPKIESDGSTNTDVAGLSVKEINFRGGKIEFTGANKLSTIRVLDEKNAEIKSVQFFSSYTDTFYDTEHYNGPNFQGTLYLDSLYMKNTAAVFERYAMMYKDKFCFGNHLKGHDAWGYCNEITEGIPDLGGFFMSIPNTKVTEDRYYHDISGGCTNFISNAVVNIGENNWSEAVNGDYAQRGLLTRIVYPTGGYVNFDFEPNQHLQRFAKENDEEPLSIPQVSGGLRIRSITFYESNQVYPEWQKYYRYGDLEEGTGILINSPALDAKPYVYRFRAVSYPQKVLYLRGPTSTSCFNRGCLNGITVEDKTTYHPASYLDYTYASGAPIYYTKVTEYQQDLGVQSGKTVYQYYPPETFYPPLVAPIDEIRVNNTNVRYLKAAGFMGAQKAISKYEYIKHQGYNLVHRKSFDYERRMRNGQIKVAYSFFRILYQVVEGNYSGSHRDLYDNTYSFGSAPSLGDEYVMGQYGIPVGGLVLTEETEEWFDSLDVRTVSRAYTYNASYWQPSQIMISDSEENTIVRYLKYSYDFNGIYDQMQSQNMVTQLIEERETFVNIDMNTVAERLRKRTNYGLISEGAGFIAPVSIESSVKGEPLETDLTFDEYDQHANLLQYTGRDGIAVSYLWGYDGLYPVAELKGVSYANIPSAYKSNAQINDPTSDASLRTVLAALRGSFTDGELIRTFTYKRLVGLTSEVAVNGRASYYEYDAYGRLTAEKNHELKLVNEYTYHLPGPLAIDATYPNYTNIPMMRTYSFACDITPTDLYRVANYIVPGGKYNDLSTESANATAEYELGTMSNMPELPPCPVIGNTAEIELLGIYNISMHYPAKVEIDFIQNGSVVATQVAPYNSASSSGPPWNTSIFHLPEGEYQISVRPSADTRYTDAYLNYTFEGKDESYSYFIQSGDAVTINKNKRYQIAITNIM